MAISWMHDLIFSQNPSMMLRCYKIETSVANDPKN